MSKAQLPHKHSWSSLCLVIRSLSLQQRYLSLLEHKYKFNFCFVPFHLELNLIKNFFLIREARFSYEKLFKRNTIKGIKMDFESLNLHPKKSKAWIRAQRDSGRSLNFILESMVVCRRRPTSLVKKKEKGEGIWSYFGEDEPSDYCCPLGFVLRENERKRRRWSWTLELFF